MSRFFKVGRYLVTFVLISLTCTIIVRSIQPFAVSNDNRQITQSFLGIQSAFGEESQNSLQSGDPAQDSLPYLFDNSVFDSNGRISLVPKSNLTNELANDSNFIVTKFQSWGKSNLTLTQTSLGSPLIVSGSTGAESAGFTARGLDIDLRYISLALDSVIKSRDSQLSFSFLIANGANKYQLLFVNGPLSITGWKNTTYYESLQSSSAKRLDTDLIFGSINPDIRLKEITIVVQKDTKLTAEFRINALSTQEYQEAIHYPTSIKSNSLVIHNLRLVRLLELEFQSPPPDVTIIQNGWQSVQYAKSQETVIATIMSAEMPVESSLTSISQLDLGRSFSDLGAKDILFIVLVGVASIIIYPIKRAIL